MPPVRKACAHAPARATRHAAAARWARACAIALACAGSGWPGGRAFAQPPPSSGAGGAAQAAAAPADVRFVLDGTSVPRGRTTARFSITNRGTDRLRVRVWDGRNLHNQTDRLTEAGWRPGSPAGYCGVGGRPPIVIEPGETEHVDAFVRGRAGTLRVRTTIERWTVRPNGRGHWKREPLRSEPFTVASP